jgi:hypothetical protein
MAKKTRSLISLRGYIPTALAKGGESAGELLGVLAAKASGVDPKDADGEPVGSETVAEIKKAVQANPEHALMVLASSDACGLSLRGRSQALDAVIGLIGDDEASAEMVLGQFTASSLAALMRAQGADVPSAIAMIADPEVVFAAMMDDVFHESDDEDVSHFLLLSWASKLKDREDWQEMLEAEIEGTRRTLREMLITSIVIVHDLFEFDDEESDRDEGQPDLDDDDCLSADVVEIFGRYGVEVDSFEEIKDYQIEKMDTDGLHDLRRRFTLRMAKIRSASLTEAREAASVTSGVAGELDF